VRFNIAKNLEVLHARYAFPELQTVFWQPTFSEFVNNLPKEAHNFCATRFLTFGFLSNNPIRAPDSQVKAFSNIASNFRSYSTKSVAQRNQ
jgi:hypothetical protein